MFANGTGRGQQATSFNPYGERLGAANPQQLKQDSIAQNGNQETYQLSKANYNYGYLEGNLKSNRIGANPADRLKTAK